MLVYSEHLKLGEVDMEENSVLADRQALEKAAKYICNLKDGLCPMVVEKIECRTVCTLETLPWECWLALFKEIAATNQDSRYEAVGMKTTDGNE
jgi:hypothetical protein